MRGPEGRASLHAGWRRLLVGLSLAAPDVQPAVARADDDPRFSHTLTGAVITRPAGAFARYDVRYRAPGTGFSAGLYDGFFVYSNEIGAQLAFRADPAWIALHLDLALEPGFFRKLPSGGVAPLATGNGPPRTFGVRRVARVQANLNLRGPRVWLYGRSTASLRLRGFREYDDFRGVVAKDEAGLEQALALLLRFAGAEEGGPRFWAYAEHTLGGIFAEGRRGDDPCPVGSVKTNVGHLESAAGVAGLVKAALCLAHGRLVPSLHFERPGPHLDLARLGLRVPTATGPLEPASPGGRVLAGLSSFSFGGTNAHAILEAPPDRRATRRVEEGPRGPTFERRRHWPRDP